MCLFPCWRVFSDIQNSDCKVAGQGVIAAAVFAALFGLLSIIFLHAETNGKEMCGRRIPFPRLILQIFSFLSLLLYIVVVATWFEKCSNNANSITWFAGTGAHQQLKDCFAGYAVATAIIAIVFSFISYSFGFWRTCSPNKNQPTKQPSAPVATASGPAAATAVVFAAGSNMSPTNVAAAASGAQTAAKYGTAYSNYAASYGNDEAAALPPAYDAAAEGTTRGGYGGGSNGQSAYGNESAGGYATGGNESAYGGNESAGGYTTGGYGY